jgi:Mrp family chromosome partitioning ATPase/capsular polysaccharide biosynthesis protein
VEPSATREPLLHEYLGVIRRNRRLVVAAMVAVPLVATAFSLTQPVRFTATSRVLLNIQNLSTSVSASAPVQASPDPPDRIAETQAELARVPGVIARVLHTPSAEGLTVKGFLSSSSVAAGANADLLSFSATAGTSRAARVLSAAYAVAFTAYRHALDTAPLRRARASLQTRLASLRTRGQTRSTIYANLLAKDEQLASLEALQTSNATVVERPVDATQVQPRTTRDAALGVGFGLLLGVVLAFMRQAIEARVITAGEVSSGLGLPLLGRLWAPPRAVRRREALVTVAQPSGALSQAYRVLRTTVDSVMPHRVDPALDAGQLLAITSATAGEGRSTTVANLGVAFARSGRRVALVNADLRGWVDERQMSLDRLFGLDLQTGLADVIRGRAELGSSLVYADLEQPKPAGGDGEGGAVTPPIGVWVLPAGSPPADLGDPATAARLEAVLKDLAHRVDVVLIDCPPLLVSADTLELVKHVDAAVVVVRANRITRPTLAELARLLGSSPVYKMGFVLTDANEDRHVYTRRRLVLTPLPGGLAS